MAKFRDFEWPSAYRKLHEQGMFDKSKDDSGYLWLNDMEWMSADELASYEPEPTQCVETVPFAYTGGYDLWAFIDPVDDNRFPVGFCPRGDNEGIFYAPSFEGALFRQVLEFTSSCNFEPLEEGGSFFTLEDARRQLSLWRNQLNFLFHPEWVDVIDHLMTLPLKLEQQFDKPSEYDYKVLISPNETLETFQKLVPWGLTNTSFPWQDCDE